MLVRLKEFKEIEKDYAYENYPMKGFFKDFQKGDIIYYHPKWFGNVYRVLEEKKDGYRVDNPMRDGTAFTTFFIHKRHSDKYNENILPDNLFEV